jgi:hypothetical protein
MDINSIEDSVQIGEMSAPRAFTELREIINAKDKRIVELKAINKELRISNEGLADLIDLS